ncbi:MAG: hypothetical protein LBK75_03155 [Oscillospiraceae bacterium]|nr:hypothetical protein [Oscillospiraceae bacterium]
MKRIASLCLLACVLALSAGCKDTFNFVYRSVSVPPEPPPTQEELSFERADNASDLKQRIIDFIREGRELGEIRLYNYQGNINRDVSRVCQQIMREEPIGAYLVDYMSPKYTALAGYTALRLTITYRPGRSQKDIRKVNNVRELTDEIDAALQSFQSDLTVEVGYLPSDTDLTALTQDLYYREPARAVGLTGVSVTLYPPDVDFKAGNGFARIAEFALTYPAGPDEMRARADAAEAALQALRAGLPEDLTPPYAALWLYDALCAVVSYDEEGAQALSNGEQAEDDLYSALVEGHAVTGGYALAYRRLCDLSDIQCRIIRGWRDNTEFIWNVIQLDGDWYHVAAASDAALGTHDWFLKTDEEMRMQARWNTDGTPHCESTQYTYDMLIQSPEEELPVAR